MQIGLNIIENDGVVWITDDQNALGTELICKNKSELKSVFGGYVDLFMPDWPEENEK